MSDTGHVRGTGEGARSAAQEVIARSWERHTGCAPVADSNFFADGGTSIGMIRLVQDVGEGTGVALEFADVYAAETYAELCELCEPAGDRSAAGDHTDRTDRTDRTGRTPLRDPA
ncbi:acyl carrier protein [Streptomyces sp. NPDC058646]|uniref:acyl carrier protein n=1 Tax=Streptomyces sp. NPDC058646 TaxID=3346574 RepID=UPI00365E8ED4